MKELVLLVSMIAMASVPAEVAGSFVPIFDGKTLDGWHFRPPSRAGDWSVEGGAIVGKSAGKESYLMFKEELGDFELKFRYRLRTAGNTGVEIRSKPVEGKESRLHGYHADIGHVGIGEAVLGAWDFHENNRGSYLARRGERVTIAEDGSKRREKIEGALEAGDVRKRGWNEVHVFAKGNRLWFTINGKIASEVIDNEAAKRLDRGFIGFQLHAGDTMVVEFREIALKQGE